MSSNLKLPAPLGQVVGRVRSSGRPVRVAPSPASVRTMVHRAASSPAIWASRFWSAVETLA